MFKTHYIKRDFRDKYADDLAESYAELQKEHAALLEALKWLVRTFEDHVILGKPIRNLDEVLSQAETIITKVESKDAPNKP